MISGMPWEFIRKSDRMKDQLLNQCSSASDICTRPADNWSRTRRRKQKGLKNNSITREDGRHVHCTEVEKAGETTLLGRCLC